VEIAPGLGAEARRIMVSSGHSRVPGVREMGRVRQCRRRDFEWSNVGRDREAQQPIGVRSLVLQPVAAGDCRG
jgi:hypothetical protein